MHSSNMMAEEPLIDHVKVNKDISFRAHKIKKVSILHKSLLKDISHEYALNVKGNLEEYSRNKNTHIL